MTRQELIRNKGVDMADLISQLREASAILRQSVAGLSNAELEATPVPGKWSTRAAVEHVARVNLGWSDMFYEAIGNGARSDCNRNPKWLAEEDARAGRSMDDALDVFERNANCVADYLETLPASDWTRKFPPVQWLTIDCEIRDHLHWGIVGHMHHHIQFIEEKRAAMHHPAG